MTVPSIRTWVAVGALLFGAVSTVPAYASSHMDAPLITLDDPANTTDVYAFRSDSKNNQYLTTALAVYPFEEPGIGPNNYRFDEKVRYEIHVALDDDVELGEPTLTYQFRFKTRYINNQTILQSYLGVIDKVFDDSQNMRQTYSVTRIDRRTGKKEILGKGLPVPPNNQGLVTPKYNQGDDGELPAREGVAKHADLDDYTKQTIHKIKKGHVVFAGQRDDGFAADIQSIFDLDFSFGRDPLLAGTAKPFDSQGGFNVHTIALNIPLDDLRGASKAGVYATTSRRIIVRDGGSGRPSKVERRQIGRQGNPLFAEALIAIAEKDRYNRTRPRKDAAFYGEYAQDPELAAVLGTTPLVGPDGRSLIEAIFIPDLIKVDLTTGPAKLSGQDDFHRLSVFGGDTLVNADGEAVAGGWPNGRRFGDDVVDIALLALGVPAEDPANADFDGITENDITFNQVFPYAATPLNGRNHDQHGESSKNGTSN